MEAGVSLRMHIQKYHRSLTFYLLSAMVLNNDEKALLHQSSSTQQSIICLRRTPPVTNDVSTCFISASNPSGLKFTVWNKHHHTPCFLNQSSCPQLDHEDLEQLDEYDLEEMDLKWQVAMISMRIKKFYKKTGRKLQFDAKEPVGFDKTKVKFYNFHKIGAILARECRLQGKSDNKRRDAWSDAPINERRMNQDSEVSIYSIDCDFHEKRMAKQAELNMNSRQREIRPIWNNMQRVNKQIQFVPSVVLTRTGKISVNTARTSGTKNISTARHNFNRHAVLTSTAMKVNTVKPIVNRVRPANVFHKPHSPFSRPLNNTTTLRTNFSKQKVNTAKNIKTLDVAPVAFGEFINKDVIEFYGSKGIKREYINARTPQQNGVAERKNRTLIEAAGTMLADSFLPNTFWAEALVLLVIYIRPFGCHVTILNTIDHLGKFDVKSELGFLVGYSLQSKAFRVYNLETKRVEENLHITFLENKPNVAGKGPTWLFDLDYLTDSMNYQPVRSENQANKHAGPQEANQNAGTKDIINAGDSEKEDESAQDCFVLPIWSSYSSTINPGLKTDSSFTYI
ncbi:retrovirus-related pol polyprotein from transposon TNT 1-94 [Tanacetum coccineum]